jgi:hypothetical protein
MNQLRTSINNYHVHKHQLQSEVENYMKLIADMKQNKYSPILNEIIIIEQQIAKLNSENESHETSSSQLESKHKSNQKDAEVIAEKIIEAEEKLILFLKQRSTAEKVASTIEIELLEKGKELKTLEKEIDECKKLRDRQDEIAQETNRRNAITMR